MVKELESLAEDNQIARRANATSGDRGLDDYQIGKLIKLYQISEKVKRNTEISDSTGIQDRSEKYKYHAAVAKYLGTPSYS